VKKTVFLCILGLLLTAVSLPAQKKADVKMKYSKQSDLMRIVLESEESVIQKIKVTTSPSQIKLDFSEPFNLTGQRDLPFEIVPAERSLVINIKEKSETKIFRLVAPARLVLDIRKKEAQPARQPEKTGEKQQVSPISKVFVIDAGHGGYDFGITSGSVNEKDLSLTLAKDLGAALSKKGKKVFLVRKVDQYVRLQERIGFVNQKGPDVFISLHTSMSGNFVLYGPRFEEQASGETSSAYILSLKQKKYAGKSKALSDGIEKALREAFNGDVIRREMPLPLLNSVGAPAVLIELPSPKLVAYDQQMKTRLINAVVNGIQANAQ